MTVILIIYDFSNFVSVEKKITLRQTANHDVMGQYYDF